MNLEGVPSPCNICGAQRFAASPTGCLAVSGRPSLCEGCGSLEHHRMVRSVFAAMPRPLVEGSRCVRLENDRALERSWFAELVTVDARASLSALRSSDYDWAYAAQKITGDAGEQARLRELLRVVGGGFLVLFDGAMGERYAAGGSGAAPRLDSSYTDGLRRLLPAAAVLELLVLDGCTLSLGSVYVVSLDERRLLEMAKELTEFNIHARIFPPSSVSLDTPNVVAKAEPEPAPRSSAPASSNAAATAALPADFDEAAYAAQNPDLSRYSGQRLREHYREHGLREGRRAHALPDRAAFARLALTAGDVLQLAPRHDRLLDGPRVRTLEQLEELPSLRETFDAVLSSHIVGFRPDFVGHLAAVRRVLRSGGRYFLLVPDKNYCFQHFMAPSTLAQLLDAHVSGRALHTLRSQVAHAALSTHNDSTRHWAGDHGRFDPSVSAIARAVEAHQKRGAVYDEVPAWYFEPESFRRNMDLLRELGQTDFALVRLYPTLLNSNEFWAVLEAPGSAS